MCYTGLFKRIVPFVLTFAVGLFVASFFVSLAFPGAGWRGNRRFNKHQEMQRLRIENEDLREKLRLARLQNDELKRVAGEVEEFVIPSVVPPVEFQEHHPPNPPKRPKHPRFE